MTNPAVLFVLEWRRRGAKHSNIDWPLVRKNYDRMEEFVKADEKDKPRGA